MNSRIEVAKFEPEPTFEKTINEIKYNHLKCITYMDMNVSAITSNKLRYSFENLKSNIIPCKLLQASGKSPQFTQHFSSIQPKENTQLKIRKW